MSNLSLLNAISTSLIKKEKISRQKAEDTAEKLIGATWDVGHIAMLKKYGYTDEDILEETKKIKVPYWERKNEQKQVEQQYTFSTFNDEFYKDVTVTVNHKE